MYKNIFKYDDMKRAEHMAVRETVGWYLFTHQIMEVTGPDAEAFLDYVLLNNIATLVPGKDRYTVMLNDKAEIIDDVVVMRREDEKLKEEARREALKQRDEYSSTATTSSRGSVKKVMRGGRRIDGYMVQVWSGGNTREDKMKAEQVGQEMKSQMPTLPVYVHFYSPRWACRIGNFKKQDEATALVKKLKKLGYRSACVVKASLITRTYK